MQGLQAHKSDQSFEILIENPKTNFYESIFFVAEYFPKYMLN